MSRLRSFPGRTLDVLCAALITLGLSSCSEDGQTAPARCADPPLPIYDIQRAGSPADDFARFSDAGEPPCLTEIGHAVSEPTVIAGGSSGASAGADATGGTNPASTNSTSGSAGLGGGPADAGAGGA